MDTRSTSSTSDKATPGKSATASAQLRAEVARQSGTSYGDTGTTDSVMRNAGTGTKQLGPSQG